MARLINANEIVEAMGVSRATAYKIIRELNAELKEKTGCRTIQGRVNRDYFERKYFAVPDVAGGEENGYQQRD